MAGEFIWKSRLPVGPLKIIALDGCRDLANKVDAHITEIRRDVVTPGGEKAKGLYFAGYHDDTHILEVSTPRFGTGEGKASLYESCRGTDLYIMCDVTNHSITYSVSGQTNHLSPDDHFQNLKRVIAAAESHAHRITVIMPFLYESRQHRRTARESLDCAMALQELHAMGVHDIITFDAHDPRVQNAIPLSGFENFYPTYEFISSILERVPDLKLNNDGLMCISPDEGAMDRAVYLANNLGVDVGMFYKRRDYSKVMNGRNPIISHEFLGSSLEGKDVIIVDDMIASGESMIDTARVLKERKAKRVFVCCTFGLFTKGLECFDRAYENGYIDFIVTTNLTYRPEGIKDREWYIEADMSATLAQIINSFNHDAPLDDSLTPTYRIQELLEKRKNDGYDYIGSIL